jgi:tungstate transport system permease protein
VIAELNLDENITTLWAAFDSRELWQIISLSLTVSLSASIAAAVIGLPTGVALAIWRFPGRGVLIGSANALLGLPPVVVGLAFDLLLSRSGPLGFLKLLFTPAAMVAQAVLALPIVIALAHRAAEELWAEYGDALLVFGASKCRAVPVLLNMGRGLMVTAALAGFGRAVSEVGRPPEMKARANAA